MAGTLRVVLGDQLSRDLSALSDLDPERDVVLMSEVMDECTYVKHHAKKIVLVLSAMRHFAAALAAEGVRVDYIRLDDPANTHSLRGELLRALERHRPERVVATESGEWRLEEDMRGWQERAGLEVDNPRRTRDSCAASRSSGPGPQEGAGCGWSSSIVRCGARYDLLMEQDGPAGGPLELRPGEPQAAAAADGPARHPAIRAGRDDARGDGAGGRPVRHAFRRSRGVQPASDGGGCDRGAGAVHRAAPWPRSATGRTP